MTRRRNALPPDPAWLEVHPANTRTCWGWGATGMHGNVGDRWQCSGCDGWVRGAKPAGPTWRLDLCARCAFLEHLKRGCPVANQVMERLVLHPPA